MTTPYLAWYGATHGSSSKREPTVVEKARAERCAAGEHNLPEDPHIYGFTCLDCGKDCEAEESE